MATAKYPQKTPLPRTAPTSRALPFLLGFLLALLLLVGGVWAYFAYGNPPVATADAPFPFESRIVKLPLNARIAHDLQQPPFPTSEDAFEAGAHLYIQNCASCHGTPGHDVPFARYMYPATPQLFKKHAKNNVVGVSDDEPGETFWKIKNGLRLTGMPAYQHLLSDDQIWDIALLLKNADQQLPDPVTTILTTKP